MRPHCTLVLLLLLRMTISVVTTSKTMIIISNSRFSVALPSSPHLSQRPPKMSSYAKIHHGTLQEYLGRSWHPEPIQPRKCSIVIKKMKSVACAKYSQTPSRPMHSLFEFRQLLVASGTCFNQFEQLSPQNHPPTAFLTRQGTPVSRGTWVGLAELERMETETPIRHFFSRNYVK